MHIISNGFEEVQHIKLRASGISSYFEVLVFAENVGVKKPHPYISKKYFSLAGAKAKNFMLIRDDVYGAQRIKMDHVYFKQNQLVHQKYVQYEIKCLSEFFAIL